MADLEAVRASNLDPTFVTALNDAIKKAGEAMHKATNGDLTMLMPVTAELMARVVAGLYSVGEQVDLQALMGHVFSRAHQIMALHDGPLTTRSGAN